MAKTVQDSDRSLWPRRDRSAERVGPLEGNVVYDPYSDTWGPLATASRAEAIDTSDERSAAPMTVSRRDR